MFIDINFPENIALASVSMIEFSTNVIEMSSKEENRNQNCLNFRHKYIINNGIKKIDDFINLRSFFIITNGRLKSFKFKDFSNFSISKEIIGFGDGNNTIFPFVKNYIFENQVYTKRYKKIKNKSVNVYIDGNLITDQNQYKIDYNSGILTFNPTLNPD